MDDLLAEALEFVLRALGGVLGALEWIAEEGGLPLAAHDITTVGVRLLVALLLGGVIGFERERHRRPAGLRTHMLVSLASAMFVLIAYELIALPAEARDRIRIDPIRVMEAVTSGVAFLAAGSIIVSRGGVHGITTGAGMWLAGAIGFACGVGLFQIAGIATLLSIVVLGVLRRFEPAVPRESDGENHDD